MALWFSLITVGETVKCVKDLYSVADIGETYSTVLTGGADLRQLDLHAREYSRQRGRNEKSGVGDAAL